MCITARRPDALSVISGDLGYLSFVWENRKFPMEDQMVRAIPFGKLWKIWAQAEVHDGL